MVVLIQLFKKAENSDKAFVDTLVLILFSSYRELYEVREHVKNVLRKVSMRLLVEKAKQCPVAEKHRLAIEDNATNAYMRTAFKSANKYRYRLIRVSEAEVSIYCTPPIIYPII